MGAFYGSILIRTENTPEVRRAVENVAKENTCKFLVGPVLSGWVGIFPNDSGQSDQISAAIAKSLPADMFHFIVHDDDVFIYLFYRNGQLIDRYNSCPDYFENASETEKQQCIGRPELFQDLFPTPQALRGFRDLLRADKDKFVFEQERMSQAVRFLKLPNALSSYEYLQSGERMGVKGWKQFVHIPDLSEEKKAKRAIAAQIKAEKKQLQKDGILLAEVRQDSIAWGTDTSNGGVLMAARNRNDTESTDDEQSHVEFLSLSPPWKTPQPLDLKTNWTAYNFCMSPSGNWLAGGFAFGDWNMRVWDWPRKVLSFEIAHSRAVGWVEFSGDEQWVYSLGGEEFIVTSIAERKPVITVTGLAGARTAAVHPSGDFAVVVFQHGLGIIDLKGRQLIRRLQVNRGVEVFDPFAGDGQAALQACLKQLMDLPKITEKLGISPDVAAAIARDPKVIQQLSVQAQQALNSIIDKVRERSRRSFPVWENPFDLRFDPDGSRLFVASHGMRVYDWNKFLSATEDAPSPELSLDAPRDDENNPNSRPLAYSVRFDPARNLLLSSCLAGVVQYLRLNDGKSGVLLKPPGELSIWRLEFTSDGKGLCCAGGNRPTHKNQDKRFHLLQVWNYSALCDAAGVR